MGFLDDLFDSAADRGSDLIGDGLNGLFGGGGGDGGDAFSQILGAVSGSGDSGGGGVGDLVGGLFGGDGGGGGLGGLVGGLAGGSGDGGGVGGLLGGLIGDNADSVMGGLGSSLGGGSWGDALETVIDASSGGGIWSSLDTVTGGVGGGILDQVREYVPSEMTSVADALSGGDSTWAGQLTDIAGQVVPNGWQSVVGTAVGGALGEVGFDEWAAQGQEYLQALGVPDDAIDLASGYLTGLDPDGLVAGVTDMATHEGLVEPGPENTGIMPPHLTGAVGEADADPVGVAIAPSVSDATDGPAGEVLEGEDMFEDPLEGEDMFEPVPEGEDMFEEVPEGEDMFDEPEPAPVATEFDQAMEAADHLESSAEDMFDGLE